MAIAFDAVGTGNGTGTSITVNITVGSGSDRVMYVGVSVDAASDFNPTVTSDVDGSFGAHLIEITTNRYLAVFRKIAPTAGAHVLTIASLPGGGAQAGVAKSFTGVDQTTPNDAPSGINGNTVTSLTQDISSAAGDMVIDFVCINGELISLTEGASQTEPTGLPVAIASMNASASYEAGAATVTMSWSWTGNQSYAQVAMNLNVAAGGATIYSRTPFKSPIFQNRAIR